MKILHLLIFVSSLFWAKPLPDDKKLLMIVVEKEHCSWCHKLEQEVFSSPQTLAKLKEKFYVVRIIEDSGNLPLFVHTQYYPSTFVYSQDGTDLIDSLTGYRTKEKFLKFFNTSYDMDNAF